MAFASVKYPRKTIWHVSVSRRLLLDSGAGLAELMTHPSATTFSIFVFPCGVALVMSLIASNVAGSTKQSTVLGIVLVAYCVGNLSEHCIFPQKPASLDAYPVLVGPQIFLADEAPVYTTALIVILACFLGAIIVLALMWFLAARENRRRDALQGSQASDPLTDADLTDRENVYFRYTL